MNDPILMAQKFSALARLASTASSDFEKATVYATAEALAAAFNSPDSNFDSYALENVEKARWSICAVVGYDITNGLEHARHIAAAISAANVLESVISKSD